jgi:uncharacterized protein YndB with AHSA1/START domain
MPSFHDSAASPAPPEEVWKLLYDPARFPDWWAGIETVESETSAAEGAAGLGTGESRYTMYPDGYPDFPMAQLMSSHREESRVTVSCLVSDLRFEWRLEPDGDGTTITVDVEIPDAEAHRLDTQRDTIKQSLHRLAALAAA